MSALRKSQPLHPFCLFGLDFSPARGTSSCTPERSWWQGRAYHSAVPPSHCASYRGGTWVRSEEHTSELQSQSNLVCRLLLEKKKKKNNRYPVYAKDDNIVYPS